MELDSNEPEICSLPMVAVRVSSPFRIFNTTLSFASLLVTKMRGTGFEPDREMLAPGGRCAFLVGFESARDASLHLCPLVQKMRGTGFEPADPYGTAPSTLRRWPGLATHALPAINSHLIVP